MKLRAFLMIFALLISILSFGSISWPNAKVTISALATPKVSAISGKGCLTAAQESDAIRKLSGQVQVEQGRKTFLTALRRSSNCRRQVIAALINAMDKPNLDVKHNQTDADLWRRSSILLADLKAVEALDFLIRHLDLDDGDWSRTMTHMPALTGVIRMGESAVPKLSDVLLNDSDSSTRQYAVFCLFFIRGRAASRVLKKALGSETDECVRRFIRESIKGLNKKHTTVEDTEAWFSAFGCTEGPSWRPIKAN